MHNYHDIYVTTKGRPRTRLSNLSFGHELACNRVGGWGLWMRDVALGKEYDPDLPLRIELEDKDGEFIVILDTFEED